MLANSLLFVIAKFCFFFVEENHPKKPLWVWTAPSTTLRSHWQRRSQSN